MRVIAARLTMRVIAARLTHRPVVTPGILMSAGVSSEPVISDGVLAPIAMGSFPSVKMLQPNGVTDPPGIACTQIITPVVDPAEIYAVNEHVTGRNHDGLHIHRFRRKHLYRPGLHNDATRYEHPTACGQGQTA